MKIALVCQDLVGQGVQYVTAMTARMFAKRGWDVDVLVSQVNADLLAQGKSMFPLPAQAHVITMPSRRGSRNALFVRRYLRNGGADLVLCESGIYSWCTTWASLGISRKHLPMLAQLDHGTGPEPRTRWQRIRTYIEYSFHYRKFFAYLFVEEQAMRNARRYMGWNPHVRLAVVNNACIDEVFEEKVKLPPTHPWLVNPVKGWKTILTAGAYEPYKDHKTLILAMKIVKDRGVKIRCVIFGRGHLLAEYQDMVEKFGLADYVSVGGYTNRLPAEMKAADGFVLSSNWESFGVVLGEALACGLPCVSTDAPYGPREILAGGKYGRLVPVNNPSALAEAILDLGAGRITVPPPEAARRYTVEAIERRYAEALNLD